MLDIYSFLGANQIPYKKFEHIAVFTTEESAKLPKMPGADTKNLFLRNAKGDRRYLVTVPHDKRVDLKELRKVIGEQKLSFGSSEDLKKYLGVEPGSVTLLGVINDTEHAITVYVDEAVWKDDAIQCHPLVNTATLVIPHEGMEKFFSVTGHRVNVIDVPARTDA